MNKIKQIIGILFLASFIFIGCEKENSLENFIDENNNINIKQIEIKDGILYFENSEQYLNTVEALSNLEESELDKWEQELGFVSLRSIQNKIIGELEYAETEDDIYEFLSRYNNYFELTLNEDKEQEIKPIVDGLVLPIIANGEGLFRIDNKVSKITQEYIITTTVEYYDELIKISNEDVTQFQNNEKYEIVKHTVSSKTGCGRVRSASTTRNNRRVKIWFIVENTSSGSTYSIYSGIKVRGYKRVLGIWYWYTTNLTLNASDYTVTYPNSITNGSWSYNEEDISVSKRSQETSVIRVTEHLNSFYYSGSNYPDYYFNCFEGSATSRGVDGNIVTLTCGQ